jgi:Pre-toxin TG
VSKNSTRWLSSLLTLILLSTILPISTSADIQPWKGNPWEGSPWEGTPWNGDVIEFENESPEVDKGDIEYLDPVLLEELEHRGWEKEDIENLQYTDPDLWEFLTSSQEWDNYFKRVGNGIGDTATGIWDWAKESTGSLWDYISSGTIFTDAKQSAIDKFHYVMDGGMWNDTKSKARYLFSNNAWNDLKNGVSSAWSYTKNIGSYLFSKQSLKDAYQYVTSGEILMDYVEDFESFATGVDPENQQKVSGMERVIAAGSILFKPVKALDKIDKVEKAADKTKMLAKVEEGKGNNVKKSVDNINPKYATSIDNKVTVKEKDQLPGWLKETFTDSQYRTVITNENITVFRTYGGKANEKGAFATTTPASNRINSKIDSALLPEWKNNREYEAVIEIPKGTELNIGKVEKQSTKAGTLLDGGADQILLPQNWNESWIKETRKVPSR